MAEFEYIAYDEQNQRVEGRVTASSADDATAKLQAQGLRAERILAGPSGSASQEELAEVAGRISDVARAELPLAQGLRSLSEEIPSKRLRSALVKMSDDLESGQSLDSALDGAGPLIPGALRGLLQTGVRTDRLAHLLDRYLECLRQSFDRRRQIVLGVAYPAILTLVASSIVLFYLIYLAPQFREIFRGFNVELPAITVWVLTVADVVRFDTVWGVVVLAALAAGTWFVLSRYTTPVFRRAVLCSVPAVGPSLRFSALAEFCHVLSLLVEQGVPLPEALRLTADGLPDAALAQGCRQLADSAERGERLERAVVTLRQFPLSLLQAFRWERDPASFADSMECMGESYFIRSKSRAALVALVLEPVVILGAATILVLLTLALFLPLIKLLNELS